VKSEGEIRRKIKQAQFRHVKRVLRGQFPTGGIWPKDEVDRIKGEYREFFSSSPLHVIAKDFPDVAALMWALGGPPDQPVVVKPSDEWLVGRMGGVMLWASSKEEADVARAMIDKIVDAATREQEPSEPMNLQDDKGRTLMESGVTVVPVLTPELPVLPPVKRSWWQRLFA
jgi:hypothetical protein